MDVVKFILKQFNRDAEVIDLNLNELDTNSLIQNKRLGMALC